MDPYAPYPSPGGEGEPSSNPYEDFTLSSAALPLVSHASPFQRADMYEDYDERKSFRDDDDARSALTSNRDDSVSQYGSEAYAPSRNMFQNADNKVLLEKDALAGEIQEGETAEVLKETSSRRRWVALCWMLTFWIPTPFLSWFGRMKRIDVQQAWREKLALNMIIWFVCGCSVFVIAVMGNLICPTEHVFSQNELGSHNYKNSPNNVFTSIRGEVFDLSGIADTHARIVNVVSSKTILQTYGGTSSDNIFPVQVCILCDLLSSFIDDCSRSALFATVSTVSSAPTSLMNRRTTPTQTTSTMISVSSPPTPDPIGTSRA